MDVKRKLVFVNTHPVQYYAPLYKQVEQEGFFDLEVWYCTRHGLEGELDKEFNTKVKWDTPLLEGYNYRFLRNRSWKPGFYNGFWGIMNFDIFTHLRKLPRHSIVVANAWNPFSTLFTIICSKILGHTTCLRAEPPLVHESGNSKSKLFLRKLVLKNMLFRFIDVFLYIGTQNRKFHEFYGAKPKQLFFSPYSVNNAFFLERAQALAAEKPNFKALLGIPANHVVILFSGKLISKKRPMDLLRAFYKLRPQHEATLVFMGDGKLRKEMEAFIATEKITDVIITGFINQSKISDYYSLADIFVMCSDIGETWGLSTNEAMNFSVPVVISDRTGNFEDLVDGNGYVFKTGDVDDLASKIQLLIAEGTASRLEKGNRSRAIISVFSYETVIQNLKKIPY